MAALVPRDGARATLKDVANHVGVAVSTVSKVVNERPDVGPEVRQKVLAAIEELGFRPNTIARGLRTQRSDTIAIVTDDLEGIFTNAMMRGVEEVAWTAGIGVLLCNTYGEPDRERLQLTRLLDKQVDALIFMSGNRVGARPAPAVTIPAGVPVVYLYEYGDPTIPSVLPDDEGGARLAMQHLIETGAKRIALLNGPVEWEATHARRRGYDDSLADAGISTDAALIRSCPTWQPEDAHTVMLELLRAAPDLDAVFCGSDDLATGALAALADSGIAVPGQVQVVGFDDRSLAVHQRPPLTTVALPLIEMGRSAGELVLRAIEGQKPEPGIQRIPCELVVRQSTLAFARK